jgi:hypothetical protein
MFHILTAFQKDADKRVSQNNVQQYCNVTAHAGKIRKGHARRFGYKKTDDEPDDAYGEIRPTDGLELALKKQTKSQQRRRNKGVPDILYPP